MIFQAEAEVRWLDHCEASLAPLRAPTEPPSRRRPVDAPEPRPSTEDGDRRRDDACWNCATCTAPTAGARPPCTRCAASR